MLTLILTLALHLINVHATHALSPAAGDRARPPVLVVAKAGPGTFRTVREAVVAAERYVGGVRVVIEVKSGVYNENVVVRRANVTVAGDGAGRTVISGSLSTAGGRLTTEQTATFCVDQFATGFVGRGVTFRNTYVGVGIPAVAFQSGADKTVLYDCSVEGFQDTLDVLGGRHFYKNTHISGAIDFIFGFGTAVFQNCLISLKNSSTVYIAAQGKVSPRETSGFVFHDCIVRASLELQPSPRQALVAYLGRPWRQYSSVVYIQTYLDIHITPTGWAPWLETGTLPSTVFFGEYHNYGPGSDVRGRAKWPGHHILRSYNQASLFSVSRILFADGDWLSILGVPFNSSI